jgi:hypothetical protein
MVWQDSWVERIRRDAAPIPPRSLVMDGYWRRGDPLPALVHYPRDVARSLALHLRPRLVELQRKLGAAVSRRPSVA